MPLFGNYPQSFFEGDPQQYSPPVPDDVNGPVHGGPYVPPPTTPIPGAGKGGSGGGGAVPYGLTDKAQFDFGHAPGFNAPQFAAPTQEEAQNEPGYGFRLKAGSDALERSAAARGTVRTGGNLKSLLEYGQNFGAQEYGNVYNRALQAYDRRYQGAKDQYAPQLAEWQQRAQADVAAALLQRQLGFNLYTFQNRGGGGGGGVQDPEPEFNGPIRYNGNL